MRPRFRRAIIALAVLGLAYCVAFEIWLPRVDAPPTAPLTLVIALGGAVNADTTLHFTSAARLRTALDYAMRNGVPLVATRVMRKGRPDITSERDVRRVVDSAGYSRQLTILDGLALTTRDEALRLRKAFPPTRIALVTSRLHTRRACATFERLGYEVTCVSSGIDGRWWKIPYHIVYESAAVIKYRWKGWI